MIDFFEEASNETIEDFANQELLNVNVDWLKENSNSMIRKQITLIQRVTFWLQRQSKSLNLLQRNSICK